MIFLQSLHEHRRLYHTALSDFFRPRPLRYAFASQASDRGLPTPSISRRARRGGGRASDFGGWIFSPSFPTVHFKVEEINVEFEVIGFFRALFRRNLRDRGLICSVAC